MNFILEIEKKIEQLRNKEKIISILLIDGDDNRVVEAAVKLKSKLYVKPILLLKEKDEMPVLAVKHQIECIFINQPDVEKYSQIFMDLRPGKESREETKIALNTRPYFAMMMLKLNKVDGVVGGAFYSTADILRSAFKVIGASKNNKVVSSSMIVFKNKEIYVFADCSTIVEPTKEQLTDIGINSCYFAKNILNIEPKIAFLSFSTNNSGKHPSSTLVQEATKDFNDKSLFKNKAIGEIQFDAAFDQGVRKLKYKKESFEEAANVFVFPNLNSGNIGVKIAQRMGGYEIVGPIMNGINQPVNDLSRGANVDEIVNTVIITVFQSQIKN